MIRLVLAFIVLGFPAMAQAVKVTSGEHAGFTRLVLQYPAAVDWQLGRTETGYELRVAGAAPGYDLSEAFSLIGRDRVAALFADPESGALHVGVACACHAFPFALRPDTIVVDLRDGQAPAGWGFETAFDGTTPAPLRVTEPVASGENFPATGFATAVVLPVLPPAGPAEGAGLLPFRPPQTTDLPALRAALIDGFARAATQDLVDPVKKPGPRLPGRVADAPMAEVNLGPGVAVRGALDPVMAIAPEGAVCPANESLAVQDWGDDRPVFEQMADAMANLAGEFDATQPDALVRAVRFHLFLGFGAEARGLMRAFDAPLPDRDLWHALSLLVDGGTDPNGALRGMAGCDGAAALWATLADPSLPTNGANAQAVLRSFSALPAHLRGEIGPPLAERFMAAGDRTTAQALSDAVLRPAGAADMRRTALMQARLALQQGDAAAADVLLAPLLADPGPLASQILTTQIDLATVTGAPVPTAVVTSIEAILREADAKADRPLWRALTLALALSGEFDKAFARLPDNPEASDDLWRLLAEKGGDEAVLGQALPADAALRDTVPVDTRRKLAERLLTLGFAEAAQDWAAADDPLLSARAALVLGKPAEVLRLLGPADGEAARKLKADALMLLDAEAAVAAYEALGDDDAAARAARQAGAWPDLPADGADAWRKLVDGLVPSAAPATTLAQSRALAENAAQTRAAITDLLATVPIPAGQ